MTLIYTDFEPDADAGLNEIVEVNGATFTQGAAGAFPGRGIFGATYATTGGVANQAYGIRTVSMSLAAGQSVFLSVDLRIREWTKVTASWNVVYRMRGGVVNYQWLLFNNTGDRDLRILTYDDAETVFFTPDKVLDVGRWYRVMTELHRASTSVSSDGYAALWVDGRFVGKTADMDNYDFLASSIYEIKIGEIQTTPGATKTVDVDNVVCAVDIWTPPARVNTTGVGCIARAANLAGFNSVGVRRRHVAM